MHNMTFIYLNFASEWPNQTRFGYGNYVYFVLHLIIIQCRKLFKLNQTSQKREGFYNVHISYANPISLHCLLQGQLYLFLFIEYKFVTKLGKVLDSTLFVGGKR
jgi:hypothetical protein